MKKQCLVVVLAAFMMSVLMSDGALAAVSYIDVNCTLKPGGSEEIAIKKFKEIVEQTTKGRFQVRMFLSGQLGTDPGVTELLKIGQTQMQLSGGTFGGIYVKEYDAFTVPFYIPTWKCLKGYLTGPMGKEMAKELEKKAGVVYFVPQKRGARCMTSNRKIVGPDDFNGLKMRVPEGPVWIDVFRELGCKTIVVPGPEVYLALKTGQVEAQENSPVAPVTRKYYEVQKYVIMTEHMIWPYHWLASKKWFDKLSAEDQQIIREAVEAAAEAGNEAEDKLNDGYLQFLKDKGLEVIYPKMEAIRQKAMPAVMRAVNSLKPGVDDAVKAACK